MNKKSTGNTDPQKGVSRKRDSQEAYQRYQQIEALERWEKPAYPQDERVPLRTSDLPDPRKCMEEFCDIHASPNSPWCWKHRPVGLHPNTVFRDPVRRWDGYRARCAHARIGWHLTFAQFESMLFGPCKYCGGHDADGKVGIDRLIWDREYEPDNCVPACEQCNRAKGRMTPAAFRVWLQRAASHESP